VSSKQQQDADGYVRQVRCRAPRERVFDAISTLRGVRSWWTPVVTGSPSPGDALTFDEAIVMRIEETTFPARVRWTCLKHTSAPAWTDTGVSFELCETGPEECVLTFRHVGIDAADVAAGWDRFLTSLASLVETGAGEPYRAVNDEALDVARAYHAAWTGKDFAAARRYPCPFRRARRPGRPTGRIRRRRPGTAALRHAYPAIRHSARRRALHRRRRPDQEHSPRPRHRRAAPSGMNRQMSFEAIADRLLSEPGVTDGTGFGTSPGLRVQGRIFAMLAREEFVVKLSATRCAELLATGIARPFTRGQGRPLKEWTVISDAAESDWFALAQEALTFVRAQASTQSRATP
jgi:uncharacterized protein YndB with AHSA1/START domain